jgi:tetratricopeptide (TPR) repeat protein
MQDKLNYDKAIADCTEAIRLDLQSAKAYRSRGFAWRENGEYEKAIVDFNKATGLDPENADRYIVLAWLLATCPDARYRDGDRASQLAEKACELADHVDAKCLCVLAAAYAEKGDFDDAVKWQHHGGRRVDHPLEKTPQAVLPCMSLFCLSWNDRDVSDLG